jgi:hypothetical protein
MSSNITNSIPDKLIGAWRRVGLIIDGKRRVDYCDVLWLQAEEWFADIRVRLNAQDPEPKDAVSLAFAKEGSFAGTASWSAPTMTWKHLLDIRENPPIDASPVKWQNGGIIEGGTMLVDGRNVPWSEEWVRLTGEKDKPIAQIEPKHVYIEIGNYAIEVKDSRPDGDFEAIRSECIDAKWVKLGAVQSPRNLR